MSDLSPLKAFPDCLPDLPLPEEMRARDAAAVDLGLPGCVLMENAAQAALRVLESLAPELSGRSIALLAGSGNNGGDAAALSRLLLERGARPVLYLARPLDGLRGDALLFAKLARACGVPLAPAAEFRGEEEIVADGLLGTGFHGSLREDMLGLVRRVNAGRQILTLALDIPSGLDAVTGEPCPEAVRATATAAFEAAKPGLLLPGAKAWTGEVRVCGIGMPGKVIGRHPASWKALTPDLLTRLPGSVPGGYKNAYGHVLVAGGAAGKSGAAHLAARAALRAGAGLVTVLAPAGCAERAAGIPEIMTCPLGEPDAMDWTPAEPPEKALAAANALAAGPGMGTGENARDFLKRLLARRRREQPAVLDADALNLLAEEPSLRELVRPCDILTPHPGEAKRLLKEESLSVRERPRAVRELAGKFGCAVILKGAGTLVTAPGIPILLYGEDIPQLSCAGSGDCLAGLAAALLAEKIPAPEAAALAVVWHGEAGRLLAERFPGRGNLAGEIADALPRARARRPA